MRVLVTGARGKVGRAAVTALVRAGHEVVATDLGAPVYERPLENGAFYVQADLRDAGHAFTVVQGCQAIVHCAAIPTHLHHVPSTVFSSNLSCTFNIAEAAVSFGVERLVNISSASVSGYNTAQDIILPAYLPADEDEPARPLEPYALAKHFGEQLMDAVARRSAVRCISLRPSWAQRPGDYATNLGAGIRDPQPRLSRWSYIDLDDLTDAIVLAVHSDLPGHEVFNVAAADNATGRPLEELVASFFADRIRLRPLPRPDASPVSCAKARRLLDFTPKRTWRNYLDSDGRLRIADR
jgi:UDP-glucose 4-epimerase